METIELKTVAGVEYKLGKLGNVWYICRNDRWQSWMNSGNRNYVKNLWKTEKFIRN